MARDGERWREMARDGEIWRDIQQAHSSGCMSGVFWQRECCHAGVGAAMLRSHPIALLKSALATPTQLENDAP